jgi:hypothetical protein
VDDVVRAASNVRVIELREISMNAPGWALDGIKCAYGKAVAAPPGFCAKERREPRLERASRPSAATTWLSTAMYWLLTVR